MAMINKIKLFYSLNQSFPHTIKKIRDNLFIVSNLKSRNEFLELQVKKYEQGNEGKKFDSKLSSLMNKNMNPISFLAIQKIRYKYGLECRGKFLESTLFRNL